MWVNAQFTIYIISWSVELYYHHAKNIKIIPEVFMQRPKWKAFISQRNEIFLWVFGRSMHSVTGKIIDSIIEYYTMFLRNLLSAIQQIGSFCSSACPATLFEQYPKIELLTSINFRNA